MKLKKLIEQHNTHADYTKNYSKNIALKKRLFSSGTPLAALGFAGAAICFILIGVFGSDLKSIAQHTALIAVLFALLVICSGFFAFGLYVLRQASKIHISKPD